jgi:hypothetical protein
MGSAISQALARAMVEAVHRIIDLILAHLEQVGLLGKELAQQAIVILVKSTLPGAIGMRKVHLGRQALGNEFMLGTLFAIVKGQRLAIFALRP